jgi:hypothetical protein
MPQKQKETAFSLEKYSETKEKRNGLRTVYIIPVSAENPLQEVEAIRKYKDSLGFVYTDDERRDMPDESMQVYIYNNNSVAIASRAYTEKTKARVLEEVEAVAEYAYTLLRNSKLLRD